MKISIITVCRNDADALNRTLQNIAQQTYPHVESIIIDGLSTDHTHEVVNAAIAEGRVQKFVSEADDGVYDAMNKGIQLATGDVIYFLNADDYFADKTALEEVATFWQSHPNCDLVYGQINIVAQHDGSITTVTYPEPEGMLDHLTFGWVCHQAMFARRELFDAMGGFDCQYQIAADYDWLFRALKHQATLGYLPRPIANYRLGGISDTDQVRSLSEMFAVQNDFPVYQDPSYLHKRLLKIQDVVLTLKTTEKKQQDRINHLQSLELSSPEVVELTAKLKRVRRNLKKSHHDITTLEARAKESILKLQTAEAELEAIKNSKLWKLRRIWGQLKIQLGLNPQGRE